MLRISLVPSALTFAMVCATTRASAQPAALEAPQPPQVQLDLGLSVITANYEHPLPANLAVSVGAGVFSTWFAPIFDVGDAFIGPGAEIRVTRFFRDDGAGLYAGPFVRVSRAKGERDDMKSEAVFGFTAGAFVGYAFRLTERIDLRLGAGAQYMSFAEDSSARAEPIEVSSPFVVIDGVVGFRL